MSTDDAGHRRADDRSAEERGSGDRRAEARPLGLGDDGTDRLWRALVESSPDVIMVVDVQGTVLFLNRARPPFERERVVGSKLWLSSHDLSEERLMSVLHKVVATRQALRYEGPEPPRWYEISVIPVVTEGVVDRVLWIAADVTARKDLERQLGQSQKLEAIGLLAGGLAHDFNNLLAIIMGFSEASARKLPPGHPVVEQLEEVIDAARRGAELTRKLLAFSRKQVMRASPVDVNAVVRTHTRLLARILGEDVDLAMDCEDGQLVVRGDAVQLEQVLLNLCTNARQAMPEGGKLVVRTRALTLDADFVAANPGSRAGAFIEVTVKDTGVGMDDATRARLFEPFFTTKAEGTGLGLATVYGVVQQHGGFVKVTSSPGAGATFRVFLPRLEGEGAPKATGAAGPGQGLGPGEEAAGVEMVLVVEDERSLRNLISWTLRDLGYKVIEAADGEEAVRTFEQLEQRASEVDLVLLDVVLPRIDGRQVYERIRALRGDVRFLLMTGYAPESTRLGSLNTDGTVPLLEKPFLASTLAAKVRSVLDGK